MKLALAISRTESDAMNKALLSSNCDEWETPPDFFEELNAEFRFTLDPCALPETAKCPTYFTPDDDGLSRPWIAPGGALYSATRHILGGRKKNRDKRIGLKKRRRRALALGPLSLC